MNWLERENAHLCGDYRLYRGTRGWSVWFYGGKTQCVLARDVTLEVAKKICEQHKAKVPA